MERVSQTPRAPRRSHVLDVSPLRESPAFARLWAGNVISGIGGQMTIVAVGLHIYELTGSTLAVALVGVVALVPTVIGGDAAVLDRFTINAATLARMGKLAAPVAADAVPAGSAQIVVDGVTVAFPLEGAIDLEAEKARLAKAIAAAEKDRDGLAARLNNPAFAERSVISVSTSNPGESTAIYGRQRAQNAL